MISNAPPTSAGADKSSRCITTATLFGHPMSGHICHPSVPQEAESLSSASFVECDTLEDPSVVFPIGSHQRPE
jgi:hypothetical protein